MSLAQEILDRIFFPNRDPHAIPVLDGGFSPNTLLDEAEILADIPAPDALAAGAGGDLYVTSGREVLRFQGGDFTRAVTVAALDAPISALGFGNGLIYTAVPGTGIVALDPSGREAGRLASVDGQPLDCVTAIAIDRDGSVLVTEGSRHNGPDAWLRDLMEKRPGTGRAVSCRPDLSSGAVLRDGLSWPAGIAADGEEILVTEAWTHRLLALPRGGGAPGVRVKNFAGYPARLRPGGAGGYWIAFFAMRTQLTEFVLREDLFRTRMMREIEPNLWIGPSLGNHFDYREPTQVGRIKKLGIQKPWAPPRSYGLVARVNDEGEAVESMHSRVSGEMHGITDLIEIDGRLLVLSKGHGKLAAIPLQQAQTVSGRMAS